MIFTRFMAIYGHKFKSSFNSEDEMNIAKREWALSLNNYSEAELVAAVDYCKEYYVWMPSIAEFLVVLDKLTQVYGLPHPNVAYEEACLHSQEPSQHQWSHLAVYYAGKHTGWFKIRSEDEASVFEIFKYNYEQLCQRVRAGESLSLPVFPALPDYQDDTPYHFIENWIKEHDVEPEIASKWLFYLTKPKGTKIRLRLQQQAQIQADKHGIKLPDDC